MMPIGPLMIEHRLIERMISLLRGEYDIIVSTGEVKVTFLQEGIDFLRTYADRTHHGKEEDILFRELEKGEITPELRSAMKDLMEDHRRSRESTRALMDEVIGYRDGDRSRIEGIMQHLSFLIALYPRHILDISRLRIDNSSSPAWIISPIRRGKRC